MSVYRTKGERISMKKFKIKTNLVSGVIMGVAALLLIILLPSQVRVPAFDSGAPSPVSYTHLTLPTNSLV